MLLHVIEQFCGVTPMLINGMKYYRLYLIEKKKSARKNKWALIKSCCVIVKGKKFVVQVFEEILQINASAILSTINTDINPLEEYCELMQD